MNSGTSVPASVPVVIVGAGPAGVTAGTLLSRYGIQCLILERHPEIYPQPRAVHCDDEVCRILDRLGIYTEFTSISRPGLGIRLLDPQMRVIEEISVPGLGPHGFPRSNLYDQPDLEVLLRANLTRQQEVTLRGNSEVTSIIQDSTGVRVTFKDRNNDTEHSLDCEYVLGCDGANSMVRSAIGGSMVDLNFEQRWLVIDVDTDADLNQWSGTQQLCNPERAGSYMRVSDTRYRWEFQLVDGETAADFQTMETVAPFLVPWLNSVSADRLELVRVVEYTFRARVADRWRDRNVFILGDAAHTTPPFIGHGLCAGLRDAMNLTWKLAGVLSTDLPDSALDSYQRERESHVRKMIRIAIGVGQVMTAGGKLGNLSRRLLLPTVLRVPRLQAMMMQAFSPTLPSSDLVIKSRRRGDLAGTGCPNAVLRQGIRFNDIAGGRFAFVTSAEPDEIQRRELERRSAVVVVAEPDSQLGQWLAGGAVTAAIVRPDGAVMQADRDPRSLWHSVPSFAGVCGPPDTSAA